MVLVAVYHVPSLRSANNFQLASLAVADLLVSTLVMPLTILQLVMGNDDNNTDNDGDNNRTIINDTDDNNDDNNDIDNDK